ncbi:MAG: hypothetical protein KC466_03490, partial [Myxococcales bacterium]|nr:hypothetical protein [Myxococcales bacterium]
QPLFDRIRAAQARIETLRAGTDPESPLGRLDRLMEGYDHTGTGDTADAAASIEEWAGIRADLAGVIRRPFGYAGPVYPLDACVWFRKSTGEWVLEVAGAINDTSLICRHPQPGDLAPEEVPGLPALHGAEAAARAALGPVLDWYQPDEEQDRPLRELIADAAQDLAADRAELLALRRALAEIRDRTGEPGTRLLAQEALSGPEKGPGDDPGPGPG